MSAFACPEGCSNHKKTAGPFTGRIVKINKRILPLIITLDTAEQIGEQRYREKHRHEKKHQQAEQKLNAEQRCRHCSRINDQRHQSEQDSVPKHFSQTQPVSSVHEFSLVNF